MRLFLNAILSLFVASFLLAGSTAAAATATATVNSISATGVGTPEGMVIFTDSTTGLVITLRLSGLPPGEHGFHIHEKGDCGRCDNSPGDPISFLLTMLIADLLVLFDDVAGSPIRKFRATQHQVERRYC
jgi:Cu/Zn superoxide dismutase